MRKIKELKSLALFSVVAFSLSAGSAMAVSISDEASQSPDVKQFNELDTNGDGHLNYTEASKDSFYSKQHFNAADKNKDAKLTQAEYSDYKSAQQKKEVGRVVDDSTITTKVKASILKEEGFSGLQVSVETFKGVVQLSGFVNNKAQITKAGEIAKSIEGVKSVKNNLIVKS
ncbi:BON domain-containing protein [Methylobacillus gramineus]|uniref:BON domain-containing protein n=1 Tax=Methylobacillus gramineus TaxID=755169 RepID=UPI001D000D45|nr:BON domain-containing protein [Methylobacillus gramineus]MCB5183927.1 BON domain-containing protein [Methylobacillus gramineus]